MKKLFASSVLMLTAIAGASAVEISFYGQNHRIIEITPEKSTGLEKLYVAYDASLITEMRIDDVSTPVNVSRYSNLGGGFAEPVAVNYDGNTAIVTDPQGDMGYIIEENGRNYCIWLVNYKSFPLALQSVGAAAEQDCFDTRLEIMGEGRPIHYYSIDGRQVELSREIEIDYMNLEWEESNENYIQSGKSKVISHLSNPVIITPPIYCNTTFTVSGDRFLKIWNLEQKIESQLIAANGIAAETSAVQTNIPEEDPEADPSNLIKTDTNGMGGSAPADITFRAYTTDAVIHNEWQIASDSEFEYIDYRFNEQTLDYTFTDEGTYYVRYFGSNAQGNCEVIGDTYTVSIGSSELRIPNAFTPNDDGINDKWKVSYRSLLSFKCTIFDRYGNELFSFTDPNEGWDGKFRGKTVKPGVYFYVIEAQGADGKKYKKGGDINILKSKRYNDSSSSTE